MGVTEHPTKIFADQVTAKVIRVYILLSFDSVRALEIHDVARATSCIELSVLKVVGTHNFAQKVRQSSGKFSILCGNDESHPLTEMQF